MKPYYSDELVTLYHGDCREVAEWRNADVLVTDPPYGVKYESNWNSDKRNQKVGQPITGDGDANLRDEVLASWGLKPALVFGRWDVARPENTHTRLIWDKGNSAGMGDLSIPWGRSEEEIYVLGRGWVGQRGSNVLRVPNPGAASRDRPSHPTPKPVGLMEMLIAKCPPGTVTDPFAGSGSTLVAAKLQQRRAIGVEFEERYCRLIADRLAQDALPFGEVS